MSQLTLAAAAGAAADADGDADADGEVPTALGAADAEAAPLTLALGLAVAPAAAADCRIVVFEGPPVNASTAPRVKPSAIGMARGTAIRAARLRGRRRHAGLCPVRIQSTSMSLG
jgi:hypothetical protein